MQRWIVVRTMSRPVGIEKGGRGFVVHDAVQEDKVRVQMRLVAESPDYALCDDAGRRVLLAVASFMDEDRIYVGAINADTGVPQGASVAALALRAGVSREVAEIRIRQLCEEGMLTSFEVPFGTVLILPDEEQSGNWGRHD